MDSVSVYSKGVCWRRCDGKVWFSPINWTFSVAKKNSSCSVKRLSIFRFQRVCSCPSQANQVGHRTTMTTSLLLMTINYSNCNENVLQRHVHDDQVLTKTPLNSSSNLDQRSSGSTRQCTSSKTIIVEQIIGSEEANMIFQNGFAWSSIAFYSASALLVLFLDPIDYIMKQQI